MKRTAKLAGRPGLSLVEVALAAVVGLIVIGGSVAAYAAVRDSANTANAREKVYGAVTVVEEYAMNNGSRPPTSTATGGAFSTVWAQRRDDEAQNPWGGPTGNPTSGVTELAAATFGAAAAPTTVTETWTEATGQPQAGNILYVSTSNFYTPYAGVKEGATSATVVVRNYAVGIYDKNGATPWWIVAGGK